MCCFVQGGTSQNHLGRSRVRGQSTLLFEFWVATFKSGLRKVAMLQRHGQRLVELRKLDLFDVLADNEVNYCGGGGGGRQDQTNVPSHSRV